MATNYDEALQACKTFEKKYNILWKEASRFKVESKKYDDNYIIDENLTIKENRVQVENLRKTALAQKERVQEEMHKLEEDIAATITDYIVSEFDLNLAQARLVYARAYDDGHSNGCEEVLAKASEYGEFARNILHSLD